MTEERPRIDVFSDVVCPWCYIGKRRLESALALQGGGATVAWHAFQLNPDLPAGGVERRGYFEEKFGGPARVREVLARVEDVGREVGIAFDFGRIERQPNTLDAHRLAAWAQSRDPAAADRVVEGLFRGYFVEGLDVGDLPTLARIAAAAGLDEEESAAFLRGDAGRAEIAAANREARRLGIEGVPFFIFERRLALSGAQPPEVIAEAMSAARRRVNPPAG